MNIFNKVILQEPKNGTMAQSWFSSAKWVNDPATSKPQGDRVFVLLQPKQTERSAPLALQKEKKFFGVDLLK